MYKTSDKNPATPQDIEKLFSRACQLHEKGRPDEALCLYKELLCIIPDSTLLHYNCGLALFELGLFPEAEFHYGAACEGNAKDPDIHYNRGLNFRRLGRLADAAQSFEAAFKAGDTTVDKGCPLDRLGMLIVILHHDTEQIHHRIDPEHE